ncbi:MAG: M23 family metallopeptidase [Clostridia bacterium]|jgi:murein DD-endopeptidase MepM/ murein hydrolase activator NlpD|nr:M23 family metallopeptidase [Clostridia bacterium]MDD4571951.1 M23 family metallopeptidase [Clostridia bacterium]
MTIKDLLNNKTAEQSKVYKTNTYRERKLKITGRLFTQSLAAVLLFISISYACNLNNDYADDMRTALSWAMETEGISIPVMGVQPEQQEDKMLSFEDGDLLMILPASGVLAKSFGQANSEGNITSDGVEIAAIAEQPVKAAADGTVQSVEKKENGYYIIINHINNVQSIYGGIGEPKVSAGESTRKGNVIGTVGEASVYFAVKENGTAVDPFLYLGGPQSINDDI